MFVTSGITGAGKTTTWKVILPFYAYASIAFLFATILLVLSATEITSHYFHPRTLALTHVMALGWGTMMILGASHQLVPVLVEGKLYSDSLALLSFLLAGLGIPLLVYGFYEFDMGWPARSGGFLIIASILAYLVNMAMSMSGSRKENIQAYFIFTAGLWLLATAVLGLILVYNFSYRIVPRDSIDYLSLHAHMGIAGWFLLVVTGVGSRLIPMFLVSKYAHTTQLKWIYGLINAGLVGFLIIYLYTAGGWLMFLPLLLIAGAVALFGNFCYRSYRQRIRKRVDEPMKISLLSVFMMGLPLLFLIVILVLLMVPGGENTRLMISYGFIIFFGWITAIILGMTFKTLPFIVWNKVYHKLAGKIKTPGPRDLVNQKVFRWMSLAFIAGFVLFTAGILIPSPVVLRPGAFFLLATSILYNWNVMKLLMHKPVRA